MRLINRVISGLFLLTSLLYSVTYEQPFIYKDPKTYSMGGTGVSVGGRAPSVLLNPAGLAKMDKGTSIGLSLLRLNVGSNANVIMSALNGVDTSDTAALISDSMSKNINIYLSDYSYIALKAGAISVSAGYVGSYNSNIKVHSGFTPSGLAELNADIFYAPILSSSFSLFDILHIGLSYKYISTYSVSQSISLADLLDSGFSSSISDDLNPTGKMSSNNVYDAGFIFDMELLGKVVNIRFLRSFFKDLKPSLGVSVLNIGGYKYDKYIDGVKASSTMPQIVNIGLAMKPKCSWFDDTTLSLEMHDITKANTISSSRGYYGMFRAGLEGYYYKSAMMDLIVRAGWYNGSYSAGLDWRFFMLHIGATTYVEELGGTVGMDPDRRYMLNLDFNF